MTVKKGIALFMLLAGCALAMLSSGAGGQKATTYTLFPGATTDTTEQASYWIPIKNASHVLIRTWSTGASTDTNYCDSITTWKTLFSDTVSFIAKDSLGTIVTSRSSFLGFSDNYNRFPMCFDSTLATGQATDTTKAVAVMLTPTTRPIRGSGAQTVVYPIGPLSTVNGAGTLPGAWTIDVSGLLNVAYMRIRVTPRTRLTTAGWNSTAGLRTLGIKGLKMTAVVVKSTE